MENNTYTTSLYIDAPLEAVRSYLTDGMNLNEYTLFSRMRERVDANTWLGTASGYQGGLYYHCRHREVGRLEVVEWHCGTELGKYYHVYPMLLIRPSYFDASSSEQGTYYHWISFVDPARRTPMIAQGLPVVHRSEARSLKANLERRRGLREPSKAALELAPHTIYVDAPIELATTFLAERANVTRWSFMMRAEGRTLVDAYDHPISVEFASHDLDAYRVLEMTTTYVELGIHVRTPFVLIPAAYAFAQPKATGFILHRVSAWPTSGVRVGKASVDEYDTEAINAKRVIEGEAGNLAAYARGCSYGPAAP